MVTRSQLGVVKPIDRLSLHTFSISYLPKNPSDALKDIQWRNSMYDEYNALVKNGTWLLVPRPTGVNMVRSMWLYKHKFHADGTLSRYKARLVANGSSQQLGVDFDETFSPVVKSATIRTVLSLVVSRFVDARFLRHVCRLQRSLYGLKQAPRAWFQVIMEYLVNISKRRAFWSLNEDILKITILKTNTPYPSRKIRRIRACTHQRPQRNKAQYAVSREDQYAVLEIWNEYNILEDIKRGPTPRNPQYALIVEYGVSTSIGYGVSNFLSITAYSFKLINTAYPLPLDTAYRSSGTKTEILEVLIKASRLKKKP
ncbi:ribonuclease H-like domain-containing protein [Tanacetum coccineum]